MQGHAEICDIAQINFRKKQTEGEDKRIYSSRRRQKKKKNTKILLGAAPGGKAC